MSCGGVQKWYNNSRNRISCYVCIFKVKFMQCENVINYKKIGDNIRKLRIQHGITQIELAKAIGISQTHMSNIEKGNTGISLWTAVKISRVLQCSIDCFADEEKYKKIDRQNDFNKIDIRDFIEALQQVSMKNRERN